MEKDIKAIVLMLSTQAMINLGVIPDPISKTSVVQLDKAELFLDLLRILRDKTEGNLNDDEQTYFNEVLTNIEAVYNQKRGN